MQEYLERVLPAKLALAESYLQNRSFCTDISILFQTLAITIRPPRQVSPEYDPTSNIPAV
jgi:lipopolysaccharide/colanic/teichoic acid biosynthesis glycosyltransferase